MLNEHETLPKQVAGGWMFAFFFQITSSCHVFVDNIHLLVNNLLPFLVLNGVGHSNVSASAKFLFKRKALGILG